MRPNARPRSCTSRTSVVLGGLALTQRRETKERIVATENKSQPPMTDEQIKNLRKLLIASIEPYALLMSKEQIVAYRDRLQNQINQEIKSKLP